MFTDRVDRAGSRFATALCSNWFWWCLAGITTLTVTWAALARSGVLLLTTHEAGDVAGDALQVSKALSERWFVTGHHTDVNVSHPGPFGLWLKAAGEWLHSRGVGSSPFAVTTAALSICRVVILVLAGWLVGAALRSRAAGALFTLTAALVFTSFRFSLPNTPLLHFFSPYPVLLLLSAGLAWSRSVPWSGLWLALAAGMVSHVHTPSMPLGVLGLFAVGVCAVRKHRSRQWRAAGAVGLLFAVPLIARVMLEPGFPFNYVSASAGRIAQRKADTQPYERFQFLGEQVASDGKLVFWVLAIAAVLCAGGTLRSRWRRSATTLLVPMLYAVAVSAASYPHQSFASELLWIPGLWVFLVAGLVAALIALILRAADPLLGTLAGVACLPTAAVASIGLLGTPLMVWFDDGFVSPAADVVSAAQGTSSTPVALIVDPQSWVTVGTGVALELQRRGVPFCLSPARSYEGFALTLRTFVTSDHICQLGPAYQVLRLSDSGPGELLWYDPPPGTEELATTTVRIGPYRCGDTDPAVDIMAGCVPPGDVHGSRLPARYGA